MSNNLNTNIFLKHLTLFQCPGKCTELSSVIAKAENSTTKDNFMSIKQSPDHDYAKAQEEAKSIITNPSLQHLKSSNSLRRTLSFDGMEQNEKATDLNLSGETIDFASVSCRVGIH